MTELPMYTVYEPISTNTLLEWADQWEEEIKFHEASAENGRDSLRMILEELKRRKGDDYC